MADSIFDPGFTRKYDGRMSRVINKDGSFNVRGVGRRLADFHVYQFLVSISWPAFLGVLFAGYILVNTLFAFLYLGVGVEHLLGAERSSTGASILSAFFFITHTFTTVGYGIISPEGLGANILASTEAMIGLLAFAIATGLLYGRFARPTARLVFSNIMLIAPHRDGEALMFRVANRRFSTLMELEATLLLMTVVVQDGKPVRKYDVLPLEVPKVSFLPLTWTLVHPLTAEGPLFGRTADDLANAQAEVLVLIKGFDDRFQQVVHSRYSYRHDEMIRNRRFAPAFHIGQGGEMVLDLRKINDVQEQG